MTKFFTAKRAKKISVDLLMILVMLVMLFPLYLLVINSFKSLREFINNPLAFPSSFYLDNFKYVLDKENYLGLLKNNFIVLFGAMILLVLFGAMAGYSLSRRNSKLNKFLYLYVVFGITLPTYTLLIPQVRMLNFLGINNTHFGLIMYYVASGLPMGIFLFNGYFSSAPKDLEEAAKLDGCSLYRIFFQIYFPLSIATIATLVLIQSIALWNDTTLPDLVIQRVKDRTLMPSLQKFYGRMLGQGTRWERVYAYAVMCMLPMFIIFFIANKFLIQGVSEGALKG